MCKNFGICEAIFFTYKKEDKKQTIYPFVRDITQPYIIIDLFIVSSFVFNESAETMQYRGHICDSHEGGTWSKCNTL